jgi:hypothetical protein
MKLGICAVILFEDWFAKRESIFLENPTPLVVK